MNLSYFISKRINKADPETFSATIHKVAIASIGIGLAILIISFLILFGFKSTIREKIVSFGAHLQLTGYGTTNSYESSPISTSSDFFQNIDTISYISHSQVFAYKAGLLSTEDEVYGFIMKGVGKDFNQGQFAKNLIAGNFINFSDSSASNQIVISQKIANVLQLEVGEALQAVFIQENIRRRKLEVVGIYDTGMEDFDEKIILGDISLIQRLNGWDENMVGGFELFVDDFNNLEFYVNQVFEMVGYDYYLQSVKDRYLEIFDWLSLINQNVYIFLVIILFVASFNMISVLLILIMERTQMIGTLKALGATNKQIRNIFINNGLVLVFKGLLWGNLIGIGLCALQFQFQLIPLDPENYYMSYVPIEWDWLTISLLNMLTFAIVAVVLLLPALFISRVSPVRSIRFD